MTKTTCWNRADANLFWYTLCLCWKRQRIMICKSPFPYISGFYKPLSDLSSAISFQGWWVLSDFAASYTEAAPLTLLQIFPVYLIHSETCIFLKWDAPRLNKMAPEHCFPLRPLFSMTILNTPFASLIIAQPELSSPPEDLFSLEDTICD